MHLRPETLVAYLAFFCVITYSLECISIFKGGGGDRGWGGEVSIFLELPSVNLKAEKDRQSKNCGQKGCKLISDLNSVKKTSLSHRAS